MHHIMMHKSLYVYNNTPTTILLYSQNTLHISYMMHKSLYLYNKGRSFYPLLSPDSSLSLQWLEPWQNHPLFQPTSDPVGGATFLLRHQRSSIYPHCISCKMSNEIFIYTYIYICVYTTVYSKISQTDHLHRSTTPLYRSLYFSSKRSTIQIF